jgi:hypothetical protein
MDCAIPTDNALEIPRPPGSHLLAFDKRGRCCGLVTTLRDGQDRRIPDWMTKSAARAELWTGWVIDVRAVEELTFTWIFG